MGVKINGIGGTVISGDVVITALETGFKIDGGNSNTETLTVSNSVDTSNLIDNTTAIAYAIALG